MIITTHKTSATDTKVEDIIARAPGGKTLTAAYPYRQGLGGVEAHAYVVRQLLNAAWPLGSDCQIEKVGELPTGYTFRVDGL